MSHPNLVDEVLRNRSHLAGLAAQFHFLKYRHAAEKFRADQLRVPAGQDGGGQFADEGRDRSLVQPAFYDPRREIVKKAVEAAFNR